MSPKTSESSKNDMPTNQPQTNPAGAEPLQNLVIVPGAGAAAPPQPQQNLMPHLSNLQRIGLNNILNEFRQQFGHNFAPMIGDFQNTNSLEAAIYWICREIDNLILHGNAINNILNSDGHMRFLVMTGYNRSRGFNEHWVNFEALPFHTQNFLMNLSSFILHYLTRQANNPNHQT